MIIEFNDAIFNAQIVALIDAKEKEVKKWLTKNGYENEAEDIMSLPNTEGCAGGFDNYYFMHTNSKRLATIVHECQHLTYKILKDYGIQHCDATDEVFAYHIDFLVNYIVHQLKLKNITL